MTEPNTHVKFDVSNLRKRTAFFYGTLMSPEVLNRVIYGTPALPVHENPRFVSTPAILHHHRRHRVKHVDYPAILPHASSTVRGTYVTGLISSDIASLDLFEGDEYERQIVRVRVLHEQKREEGGGGGVEEVGAGPQEGDLLVEGEEVEAETYIWVAGRDALEDEEWDFDTFRREKMRRWAYGEVEGEQWGAAAAAAADSSEEDKQAELKSAYLKEIEAAIEDQANKDGDKGVEKQESSMEEQTDEPLKSAV